jgi:hypothetical protein
MSISNVKEYKRYFGDFRGVDFASDQTQVSEKRFARAVNVYKDYQTSNGHGIETIPGFRRRVQAPNKGKVYGIHTFNLQADISEERKTFVHAGTELYLWENFADEENEKLTSVFSGMNERESVSFVFNNRLYIIDGKNYIYYDGESVKTVKDDAYIPTTYINIIPDGENADIGAEYEQRNMLSPYFKHTFIVTEYKTANELPVISTKFYMNEPFDEITSVLLYGKELTYKDDYTVDKIAGYVWIFSTTLPEKTPMLDENGEEIKDASGNTVNYPEMHAGVEITAKRKIYDAKDVRVKTNDGSFKTYSAYKDDAAYKMDEDGTFRSLVETATIATVFDNRIFFSGFPGRPSLILYCARNSTGYSDPSYIGVLNYMQDGVGDSSIKAMVPIANALLVLKARSEHESSVYYHTPTETGLDIVPKVYPSESGLAGTGCLGAAINFLDDPVYISSLGVEAIGQLSVRYERAREHRSSLVDAVLVNNPHLKDARLCEWNGYLLVLVGGCIFMADSRQKYQASTGDIEYEWYYLEDIGVYDGQTEKYEFIKKYPKEFIKSDGEPAEVYVNYQGVEYKIHVISDFEESIDIDEAIAVLSQNVVVSAQNVFADIAICEDRDGKKVALLCETFGEMHGGVFQMATAITSFSHENVANVYFGCENGVVCSFNFDKRTTDDGLIDSKWYTFDNRRITSGISLTMDNCGWPDTTKTTIKKSLVVKARSMSSVAAKINVRTNRKSDSHVGNIAATFGVRGFFSDMNFQDVTFFINDMPLFSLNEKEKKWVEKQYSIYSDIFQRPFSLVYLMYRYRIVGKYKGK